MKAPRLLLRLVLVFLVSCSTPAPTPVVILATREVIVTRLADTPAPAVLVATSAPSPTASPSAPLPSAAPASHDWVDYGGLCTRPDNLPPGVQINPQRQVIERTHQLLLAALWRTLELSGAAERLTPSFSTFERFETGIQQGVRFQGLLIPTGKAKPRSDPWSFFLQDAEKVWRRAHPRGTFPGLDLGVICFEFYDPFAFEEQKRLEENPSYLHLVGGVSHAFFAMDEIFGAPRLAIKLYQNPYNGQRAYQELRGFAPDNSAADNVRAANQHLGAVAATLNTVLWGNFDGDGVQEFGYGPANSDPVPLERFEEIEVFTLAE